MQENNEKLKLSFDYAYSHGMVLSTDKGSVHVPFALNPMKFPAKQYETALQLQPIYNYLVERMAKDSSLIKTVMDQLADHDEFTKRIYEIYKQGNPQSISLGLFRSDYMLENSGLKQIEMNTISVSFSSLSAIVSNMHRYTHKRLNENANVPLNKSGFALADGIAKAFQLYGNNDAIVVMVVQPGETNRIDQRFIEKRLWLHKINCVRKTLAEINDAKIVNQELIVDGKVVAVTYFRAGYTPKDYGEKEWQARSKIEQSLSIKCPDAGYHLVGSKKFQQVIADKKLLRKYLGEKHTELLFNSFAGLWGFDGPNRNKVIEMAKNDPDRFVLKPQREGGGNNIYGSDILKVLETEDLEQYILMELIHPQPQTAELVRKHEIIETDVVSELGIFGVIISDDGVVLHNEEAGYLLRTKSKDSNEGGVAAGFAVLDSLNLVES